MAILPIIEMPDPRLRTISQRVTIFDDRLDKLAADMLETMYAANGIGLAAIQIGQPLRLLVIDLQESDPDFPPDSIDTTIRAPRIFVNPILSDPSSNVAIYQEGCLSVPIQYAEIKRPAEVTVDWMDIKGNPHQERMGGLIATCIQHETDHLEGVLFVDRLSRLKREMLLKKTAKLRKVA